MAAAGKQMKRHKRDYVIQTVRNCLRLLAAFRDQDELGVTELARRLGLHKNNVFRLLATLEQERYIEQNLETDRYRLGAACLELARSFTRNRSLVLMARPILFDLVRESDESVHLGVLSDFEVMHLDGEQPDRLVLTGSRVAQRLPAHCTALGKVLLGCGDPAGLAAYDERAASLGGLRAFTDSTLVDRDKLLSHLHAVGTQGYAVDLEECEPGLCCAAAPVYDAGGRVVAALSISGPAFRLDAGTVEERLVPLVTRAAERLSALLGYAGRSLSA